MTKKPAKSKAREDRLHFEIIVDAHDVEEQVMGWHNYLEDKMSFPFTAKCIGEREISPLQKGDKAEVIGLASEDECQREMFVEIQWERRGLAVPLSQIKPIAQTDAETKEAVDDWHYWVGQGYEFG
ncbi:MAG: calcium-binding protein [Blastocatellia bacterium]